MCCVHTYSYNGCVELFRFNSDWEELFCTSKESADSIYQKVESFLIVSFIAYLAYVGTHQHRMPQNGICVKTEMRESLLIRIATS